MLLWVAKREAWTYSLVLSNRPFSGQTSPEVTLGPTFMLRMIYAVVLTRCCIRQRQLHEHWRCELKMVQRQDVKQLHVPSHDATTLRRPSTAIELGEP